MGHFNITELTDCEIRRFRTHAFVARLFAQYPLHPSNAEMWTDIARSWEALAKFKEQVARTNGRAAHTGLQPWV